MKKQLDRTLGLYSALTISVGTMIGSAIFVLAGTSYRMAGPSASLSIFLAGIGAFFTAFSFCELVTVIPRAGGGYAYAREAAGRGIIAFITGWGFWLAYAMSCGLFSLGFGTFLNYFFPFIPPMLGAYVLIFYVMLTNIKGVENTGNLQNWITTLLILLLGGYIVVGVFFLDLGHQKPYFTHGMDGMFSVVGLLYMTYIGYGLITTASEEVINPEKTIPRAILISLVIVTFIKTAVFFIGCSVIVWTDLLPTVTRTPLTDTAVKMLGQTGGYLFALAGIFATVSSINTAMLASARTSFAMARDNSLPAVLGNINAKTHTPIASVLMAAVIVTVTTSIRNLEHISTVTSLFALTGYSFVNLALIIFRRQHPKRKAAFQVPFYPLTPILGIVFNMLLVVQLMRNNPVALLIAVGISAFGVAYYYMLLPRLRNASKIMTTNPIPTVQLANGNIGANYKVMVPVASLTTVQELIAMARLINGTGGQVQPVHVIEVPEVIPMDSQYYSDFVKGGERYQRILDDVGVIAAQYSDVCEPVLMLSRKIRRGLTQLASQLQPDLVLLGWHPSGMVKMMHGGVAHQVLESLPVDVGIYKKGSSPTIKRILCPYGGGMHSQGTVQMAKRISTIADAKVTLLHVVDEGTPVTELVKIDKILNSSLAELGIDGDVWIVENASIWQGIIAAATGYDLVIMGVGSEWGFSEYITGRRSDLVMEKITCHGLIIRKHNSLLKVKSVRRKWIKLKTMLWE